jgi:DNA-binding transcriptional ArsR family regulator
MNPQPAITSAAALIANPARAAMLIMLVDGRAHPAGELACCAGVSAQTASSHLAKLLAGGLLRVESEGRHRYYRLAGPRVVSLLEHLASVGPSEPMRRRAPNRAVERLRFARCCYDPGAWASELPRRCSAMATSRRETERPSSSRRTVSNGSVTWDWMLTGSHRVAMASRASASTGPSVNTILLAPSERTSWRELATLDGFSVRPLRAQLMSHRKVGKRSRRIWALKGRTSG